MFESLGVPALDADLVARQIHQNSQHPAARRIADDFPHLMATDGRLQRGVLLQYFVANPEANRHLRTILKPFVMEAMRAWSAQQSAPYVVWESALLLEEAIEVDRVLVVDAFEEQRLALVRRRNAEWNDAQIRGLMAIQMPRSTYLQQAHDVITNVSTLDILHQQVSEMHRRYIQQWGVV